jgi:hypothetical protein
VFDHRLMGLCGTVITNFVSLAAMLCSLRLTLIYANRQWHCDLCTLQNSHNKLFKHIVPKAATRPHAQTHAK